MKALSMFAASVLLCASWSTQAAAQMTGEARRPAMPLPPPPAGSEAARENLRYDPGKSPEENARTLQTILEKLRAAQERVKEIDRQKIRAATQAPAEAPAPPLQDPERASAVQEATGWERQRAAFVQESQCGPNDDTEAVELYKGDLGPTQDFVSQWQRSTGQIQWNASFSPTLQSGDDAGNVEGVRWCTGTLISDRIFLSAGHCFDINSNDWT